MKDVLLKISGKTINQSVDSQTEDELIEFITEGKMASRGNCMSFSYLENGFLGAGDCTTSLTVCSDKVKMKRTGKAFPDGSELEFEKGKRFTGLYETPYGSIGLEILTNEIQKRSNGLSIDYSVSLGGQAEIRHRFDIDVLDNN
ncbi:MAG: DUF1934 domain-containing protein [Firmicutes bacterium]|jgi:uncharacterized beta-barrel protein YwiB (DUF1934 family)|nr:DUF1934 domain-containing protein [Bacillota bacterium]